VTGQGFTAQVEPESLHFTLQAVVSLGGARLSPERAHLTFNLAEQVVKTNKVIVGSLQTAFGAFLASTVFENSGCLLDNGTVLLG